MSQRKNVQEKQIPLAEMEEGIQSCLKKATEHLDGAESLIEKNLVDDSVALVEFAIEEFGRAVILKDMLRNKRETILFKQWKDHQFKYDKAFEVLPKKLKTKWKETFWKPINGRLRFKIGVDDPTTGSTVELKVTSGNACVLDSREYSVSPDTRCDAIFVDFMEERNTWRTGIKPNAETLNLIITQLRENVKTFTV